jgi:hypothetical protein
MSSFITASGVTDAAVWDNTMVRASGETRNGARRQVGPRESGGHHRILAVVGARASFPNHKHKLNRQGALR